MSELIALTRAVKSFGDRRLLQVGPLTLSQGDLIVLTGDNGSGKTTLLKMLAGLEHGEPLEMRLNGFERRNRNP
jgi:ABC-type multidrug transport system ATPase subunit